VRTFANASIGYAYASTEAVLALPWMAATVDAGMLRISRMFPDKEVARFNI
jgi:hypothetical protein